MTSEAAGNPAPRPHGLDFDAVDKLLADPGIGIEAYRTLLGDVRRQQSEQFDTGVPIRILVAERAQLVDRVLRAVWRRFDWPRRTQIALVAVGGYGRGELHPASDIDIMILLDRKPDRTVEKLIEQFLAFAWDLGLEVGHSVRTVRDCKEQARQDITVVTNLMESRLLLGPEKLYAAMRKVTGPAKVWPSTRFFAAKFAEQQARHLKYEDTIYNLEPNIKEAPGGLRDIQMIGWVAKRHFGVKSLDQLAEHGFLTEHEFKQLDAGQDFLWQIRFALHDMTGRREDRLLFDYQRVLAEKFGHQDSEEKAGVEMFMQEYYRTVIRLNRLNEMLLQHFQETFAARKRRFSRPKALNSRFQVSNYFIEVTREDVFEKHPLALLEIFYLLQLHPWIHGVRASTIRLIRRYRHLIDEDFRNDLRARSLFIEILRQPHGITHELRRMNRYGILARYLPLFGRIVGQMQFDLFHTYTVDEHTLFVVRNLRRFTVPEYRHEFPLCSEVIATLPKLELLYIAGLFHDIAKGRGGNHSELGAEDAYNFCLQHELSEYDARLVSWLVQHHLIMSETAQRKDISDPDVINTFARQVSDKTHLDYLYLLTVADIRATNPTLWNSWKDSLFMELYNETRRALRSGLASPIEKDERIREVQQSAEELLASIDSDVIKGFWKEFGDDYFLRYSPDEIAWHIGSIMGDETRPLVLVRDLTHRGGSEVFIYCKDRDYLFSSTVNVLDRLALNVVDARIITSSGGYALDSFTLLDSGGKPVQDPKRLREIHDDLFECLSNPSLTSQKMKQQSTRRLRQFSHPTQVNFSQDGAGLRTVMEVRTVDQPGLLSAIGEALSDCGVRLQNAKIATFGERVEDMFFITDADNRPLEDEATRECLRSRIVLALTQEDGGAPGPGADQA